MHITELTKEQFKQVKCDYLIELDCEGSLKEVAGQDCVTYEMMENPDKYVSDDVILEYYNGVVFTEDDFIE